MKIHDDIISFDLRKGQGSMVDVAKIFPLSEIHAIRSTKAILDTIMVAKKSYPRSLDTDAYQSISSDGV